MTKQVVFGSQGNILTLETRVLLPLATQDSAVNRAVAEFSCKYEAVV